jgi:hypothetical protein
MNNKKYNPEDYKDVEFITIGNGSGKNSISTPCEALSAGNFLFFAEKLFTIESELGLNKKLSEQ